MKNKIFSHTRIQETIKVTIGFIGAIAIIDSTINLLFPYPKDPQNTSPNALALYFDYGRSIEGKVKRQLGAKEENTAPIALAGWLKPPVDFSKPPETQAKITPPDQSTQLSSGEKIKITVYGMSFANHVAEAMKKLNPDIEVTTIGGPAAPPNHSFAAYQVNRTQDDGKIIFWGILASSLFGLDAMTGMTLGAEVPAPFTFPKYSLKNNQLQSTWPAIDSIHDLISTQQNPRLWEKLITQLKKNDFFYDEFSFQENILDNSVLVRLLRRAWIQNNKSRKQNQIHSPQGFNPQWQGIAVLNQMIVEFNHQVKEDGKTLFILLINDRGFEDHLFQILEKTLTDESIAYVSTHNIVSNRDLSNFLPDGHFTPEANEKIARKVLESQIFQSFSQKN